MSVFLEPTHLFPRYMCQAGVLAEFLLIYLHSELGKSGKPKKKKKKVYIGRLILKSIYLLVNLPQKTTSKFTIFKISVYSTFGKDNYLENPQL